MNRKRAEVFTVDTIHKLKLSKMFPEEMYAKGKYLVDEARVSDLLYDMNNKLWTANVGDDTMHFVELNVGKLKEGSLIAYCDCPVFATYDSCEHIVAVLLMVQNRSTPSREVSFEETNHFIQSVMMNEYIETDVFSEKIPLIIEYYISWDYDKDLLLEMRVGEDRSFIVRNLYEFIKNVLANKEHYFTKTFTFDPERHYIVKQDLRILEKVFSILQNEKMLYSNHRLDYDRMRGSKRNIIIPYFYGRDLLDLLVNRNLFVDAQGSLYDNVTIDEENSPFRFSLTKDEGDLLQVKLQSISKGSFFPLYNLLFIDGSFYIPSKEEKPVIEQIDRIGMKNFQLPISSSQKEAFISEVLPSLKRVGHVDIDEAIEQNIIQLPLQPELYLDIKDNYLIGDLRYRYGSYTINPFEVRESSDLVILREVEKEQIIMQAIEHANFKYNGEDLYIDLSDEESLYDFLYTHIPAFEEHLTLYITDQLKNLIIEKETESQTRVDLPSDSNLLEIGFDISGINEEEIPNLLQALIEKRRYYRTNSGSFLSLENEHFTNFEKLLTNLQVTDEDIKSGKISLPIYRAAQVAELFPEVNNYTPSFEKLLQHLESPEKQIYTLPEDLQANLRNYQKVGYQWFKSLSEYRLGGILADDMGLGKTLQSIAYILSEKSKDPHLIVVPSSVVYNWKNECKKFAPKLTIAIIHGSKEERLEAIESGKDKDLWITSYATLRQDIDAYDSLSFRSLILDEAQYIKNYQTKTSQAVRQIKATRRFALSGTPIENSIDELWAIFQVVLPGLMPSLREFKQLDYEKIASITRPFILRRVKEDVLTELPEKIESVSVSELSLEQKELYLAYLHELQRETSQQLQTGSFQEHRMQILAGLTRLRQICSHPSMFLENYEGGSGKLDQLLETIETSLANGRRMLVFSQFTTMHEIIIQELEQRGIDYFYLHGQTPAEERVEMSNEFNAGEKDVFLISLRAGGTGLNLTGADTVLLYDLWWNPAVEDQATGRAHRFGQKNVVQVLRFITEGTIEEKIYDLQQRKRELIDQVLQPGETMLSSLSEEDIRELLNLS